MNKRFNNISKDKQKQIEIEYMKSLKKFAENFGITVETAKAAINY